MTPGDPWARADETRLQQYSIQVLASQRIRVTPESWRLDLLSPFWRLYRMREAGAFVKWAGGRVDLEPGWIYLIPAWLEFGTFTRREVLHEYVHFYVNGLPATWLKQTFDRPAALPCKGVLGPLTRMWAGKLEAPTGGMFDLFGWTGILVKAAMVTATERLPEERRERFYRWLASAREVQRAVNCIDTRLANPPDNAELAALCGMSPDHFIRRFKAGTGLTPAQYRLERRVLAAAHWLAGTGRTIEDIAESAGFTDRFYLTKMFKARLAVTPAAYRRMHRLERAYATRPAK